MKKTAKRLTLNRETLQQLDSKEASLALGAATINPCSGNDTCFCSRFRCTIGSDCLP